MSKKFKTKKAKYRSAICGFVAVAASFAMFASACDQPGTTPEEDENTSTSTRVDEQTLKNGNFEFFEDNDGSYLLGSPDNWSSGTGSGATASDSGSGTVGTTNAAWNRLTDPELPQKIWDNKALDSDDENYVNYNGDAFDLPLRDPASAITENEDDDADDVTDDYIFDSQAEFIDNPYTHDYRWAEEDGEEVLYDAAGQKVEYYTDDEGNYYTSQDLSEDSRIESNVLMIHNYVEDDKQGSHTYFSSSTTLSLEANTAAKLSVWVKTSDLFFGGNNDERREVTQDRGAYIEVSQTVGGTTLDAFRIENINTQLLNPYNEQTGEWEKGNNGWMQYTVYVSACNYAATTISLTVGLGKASIYTLEGYAFFDDITYEKYLNTDEMTQAAGADWDKVSDANTCTLLYEGEDKIYRTDRETINKDHPDETVIEHHSNYDTFYIDLTAENESVPVNLGSGNLSAGLTVDDDNYTTSLNDVSGQLVGDVSASAHEGDRYLSTDIRTDPNYGANGFDVSNDVIANLSVTASDSWTSAIANIAGSTVEAELDEALKTAVVLPGAGTDVSTLLMFSARGAAYESVISDAADFTIAGGEYKIVTFWVKTSDQDGNSTANITVRQKGNDENSASIQVDSTTIAEVTINDRENVYEGWVQCYALIGNELESGDEDQQFEIVVNYGPTAIKDAALNSYYPGWVAVTNISVLTVDETAFGYADTSSRAASITITEESEESGSNFDEAYGSSANDIESQITRPANYTGVNGGSADVLNDVVDINGNPDYHSRNDYEYAGLINKDYREAYAATYRELLEDETYLSSPIAALFGSDDKWNEVLGSANQPLLIINTVRTIADKTVNNYGFYGARSTVNSDSYTAVSVKVKVSAGAVATVYLVDPDNKETLKYVTPEYTFWYDNDGNVLKGEPDEDWNRDEQRANIAYTLREDGLYEDEDGNLYANLYNLDREYFDERADYYDENGTSVSFDELEEGKIYYANAERTEYAEHNLVTTAGDRVYRYVSGLGDDVVYSYFVNDEPDNGKQVKPFDTTVAVPRYTQEESTPYSFTIDAIANPELADRWITVSFFIHTGNAAKNYRLEVWSGTRDGAYTEGVTEGSYVLFDYSSVSLDESTYSSLLSHYSDSIIEYYRDALEQADPSIVFDSNSENIAYYEKLAADMGLDLNDLIYDYSAQYYTYTLYDSATYIPFNGETAEEGESGYNYTYSEYSEQLAALRVDDTMNASGQLKSTPMLGMFIDYSALDKDISLTSPPEATEDEETVVPDDGTNVWLLASSIVMVVAILIAIAVLVLRDMRKRFKVKGKAGKNTYNYKKNRRYVRTYVKEHGETPVKPETDGQSADTPDEGIQPAETNAGTQAEPSAETTEPETDAGANGEDSTAESGNADDGEEPDGKDN